MIKHMRRSKERNEPGFLITDLSNLDTPVEEQLGTDVVLVLPDIFKEAAIRHQLGDQLHGGSQADPQQAAHVGAGHSCHDIGLLWEDRGSSKSRKCFSEAQRFQIYFKTTTIKVIENTEFPS